jgi:tRNA nucleotidyltransferase/poly(A) polymerase
MVISHSYLKSGQEDILTVLCEEHKKIGGYFDEILLAPVSEKEKIVKTAIFELAMTMRLEEELLYRLMYREDPEQIEQVLEEHHVLQGLISELETMNLTNKNYQAKFMVLGAFAETHFSEEEAFLFPVLEDLEFNRHTWARKLSSRRSDLTGKCTRPSELFSTKKAISKAV